MASKDKVALSHLVKNAAEVDLTLPLRGVTALSLSIYLRHADVTREGREEKEETRKKGENKCL